jgi:hypothetical protein
LIKLFSKLQRKMTGIEERFDGASEPLKMSIQNTRPGGRGRGRGRGRTVVKTLDQGLNHHQEKNGSFDGSKDDKSKFQDADTSVSARTRTVSESAKHATEVIDTSHDGSGLSSDKENNSSTIPKPTRSRRSHFDAGILSRINKQLQQGAGKQSQSHPHAQSNPRNSRTERLKSQGDSTDSSPNSSASPTSRLSRIAKGSPTLALKIPSSVEITNSAQYAALLRKQLAQANRPRSHTDPSGSHSQPTPAQKSKPQMPNFTNFKTVSQHDDRTVNKHHRHIGRGRGRGRGRREANSNSPPNVPGLLASSVPATQPLSQDPIIVVDLTQDSSSAQQSSFEDAESQAVVAAKEKEQTVNANTAVTDNAVPSSQQQPSSEQSAEDNNQDLDSLHEGTVMILFF